MIVVASLLGVAVMGFGGWMIYGKLTAGQPATTAQVKRSIWKFLTKQTGDKTFKVPTDFSIGTVAATTATLTNKAGRIKTVKPLKSGLPETSASAHFRTQHAQAASYREIYRLVGQQLTLAEQWLNSGENGQRLNAVVLASEASTYARTNAVSLWLGARICEAYLWPNLSLVETNARAGLTTETLLNICDTAFQEAGETNNMIRNCELMIAKSKRPSQLDSTRFRLAHFYQDKGEDAKALAQLKLIKNYKMTRVESEIAALEKRLGPKK
jgi:hypothetical protein